MLLAVGLIAWVFASPFAAGAVIGGSPLLRRALARVYPLTLTAGWLGIALMGAGVATLDGATGLAALLAGGPLAGLALWGRRVEDDDSGGGEPEPPPDEPPPGDEGIDWDSFERAFREYASRRPGTPVVCATGPSSPASSSLPAT